MDPGDDWVSKEADDPLRTLGQNDALTSTEFSSGRWTSALVEYGGLWDQGAREAI